MHHCSVYRDDSSMMAELYCESTGKKAGSETEDTALKEMPESVRDVDVKQGANNKSSSEQF